MGAYVPIDPLYIATLWACIIQPHTGHKHTRIVTTGSPQLTIPRKFHPTRFLLRVPLKCDPTRAEYLYRVPYAVLFSYQGTICPMKIYIYPC